ncbi:response regulator transcription factor [Corticimicrobacter populi]|uniref:response regulator transcription factor n=1 Tax=Corticimicrobacter populi TaxID=2175229 RepID=UPI00139006C7|nr:response regulator transcription factor [Corticimicrobacter populi]
MPPRNAPTVLIVEDDAALAENLFSSLEADGFVPDIAYDGSMAIEAIDHQRFDLIVLDIGLPHVDGWTVLRHLRTELGLSTPVLILTARQEIEDKRIGFNLGADDYQTKPFSLEEISLRLHALLRRSRASQADPILRCGALTYALATQQVCLDDTELRLPRKSLQILEALMRQPGRIVSRTELEQILWPDETPASDALRSHMHVLRKTLAAHGFEGLETLSGSGWKMTVPPLRQSPPEA